MHRIVLLSAVCCIAATGAAQTSADTGAQEALEACRGIADRLQRLACYDDIPGPGANGRDEITTGPDAEQETLTPAATPVVRSRMTRDWELDDATHDGLFQIRSYRAVYALPARYTSRRNNFPNSPAPDRSVTTSENLDSLEAKFQLSLKSKLLDNVIGDNGDLWFAFTQQSSWQAYNGVKSSPFRETNYAPEVFATWRTGLDLGLMRWQFVNLGFVHQSNGRSEPRSRSWNRVYADFGFERGDWQVFVRPWLRVEVDNDDDNPDIEDFLGNGDIRVKWSRNNHDLGALIRYQPSKNRGALQLDWHYPLVGDLKGYVQLFTGYGETLIDYNHRQTTIGVGVSLVQ